MVLAIACVGFVGGDPRQIADDIVNELGLSGSAAKTITDAVRTAQDTKVASSIIGVVGLLWAGTGLAASLTAAWNQTWRIPGGGVRGRALGFVWLLGGLVLFAIGVFVLSLVGGNGALPEIGVIAGVLVNTIGFVWTAWVLPTRRIPIRSMLPAAIVGGVCLEVLKIVGTFVIPQIVSESSELYGAIGSGVRAARLVPRDRTGRRLRDAHRAPGLAAQAPGRGPGHPGHGASRSMTHPVSERV